MKRRQLTAVQKRARNERRHTRRSQRERADALVARPEPPRSKPTKRQMEQIIMRATNEDRFKIAREMNISFFRVRSVLRRFRRGLHRGMPKLTVVG